MLSPPPSQICWRSQALSVPLLFSPTSPRLIAQDIALLLFSSLLLPLVTLVWWKSRMMEQSGQRLPASVEVLALPLQDSTFITSLESRSAYAALSTPLVVWRLLRSSVALPQYSLRPTALASLTLALCGWYWRVMARFQHLQARRL